MDAILQQIESINNSVNGVVWGIFGLVLLIGTGVIVTLCTGVFQVSHIKLWWRNTIGSLFTKNVMKHRKEKGVISPFQALGTALAATVGTGNIAGVAAAICVGGAGAVFWMWVAAFFGMMTNYAENVLGIYFRRKNSEGEWSGGAMYYLQDGVGKYSYKDHDMFDAMIEEIRDKTARMILSITIKTPDVKRVQVAKPLNEGFDGDTKGQKRVSVAKRNEPKVGRNDPCPCGSGKKYKKCCGSTDNINQ